MFTKARIKAVRFEAAWLMMGLLAACGMFPELAWAQEQRATLVHQGVDLRAALLELREKTQIGLSYRPELVAGKKSFCVAQDQPAEDLLRCVLKDTGLDYIKRSSGTYVLQVAPERAPLFGRIRGKVVDALSGEPIPDAHVWLPYKQVGRLSNRTGRFVIAELEPGQYRVTVSFVGYRAETAVVIVPPDGEVVAEFKLAEEARVFSELVVEGLQAQERSEELGASEIDPSAFDANGGPTANTLRTLNGLMGVRVNDVTSEVHVQGGETGEHQFRLDGAPVFMPLSLAGLVGPYSPAAIKRITVHKAGFGVSEGSQLAGVIEAEHDVSYTVPREWDVQVDPLSLNTRLSTPYGSSTDYPHSFMLAGRVGLGNVYMPQNVQSVLDGWNELDTFILTAFSQENSPFNQFLFNSNFSLSQTEIGFQDVHMANRLRFGPLRNLHSSFYFGGRTLTSSLTEQLDTTSEDAAILERTLTASATNDPSVFDDAYDWRNGVAQTRFESVLGARALASVQVRGSFFDLDHTYQASDTSSFIPRDDRNEVQEYAAEATLDYAWSDRQNLQVGIETALTRTKFSVLGTQALPIQHASDNWRMAVYWAQYIDVRRWLSLELGSRLTYLPARQTLYGEPRISLRLDGASTRLGAVALRTSVGMYRQFVNQFDISSRSPLSLMPSNRVWLAVDSTLSPPLALHATTEILYQPTPKWTVRLEGFYKRQHHALTVDYAATIPEETNNLPQQAFLSRTNGHTAGVAFELSRQLGPGQASLRYEYTEAKRSVEGWFGGTSLDVPWREPHRVEVGLDVVLLKNLSFVARGQGVWGRTWGFRRAYYEYLGAYIPPYPENVATNPARARYVQDVLVSELGLSNSRARSIANQVVQYNLLEPASEDHELPTYLQLDLGLAYSLNLKNTSVQARFDAINVLDRENLAEWQFVNNPNVTTGFLDLQARNSLPFIPSFTLRVGW